MLRAQSNAELNKINNSEFHCADLCKDISQHAWAQQKYDKILIDPPRSGALEMMHYIANFSAERIIYISCNPATLARDAAELAKQGYQLNSAGIMDMFPHTSHVEAIAVFTKPR